MNDNVTFLSEQKATAIAQQMGWSLAFAEGYIAGQSERWRGNRPSSYAMVGVDDYARGFRAGYFERPNPDRGPGRCSVHTNAAAFIR
jgi:hypothetical protein